MLEYMFFHADISRQFCDRLRSLGIEYQFQTDQESWSVGVEESLDDEMIDVIERHYDELLDATRDQIDDEEGRHQENYAGASLLVTLRDGNKTYVHLDPGLLNRMLQNISHAELDVFIDAIVSAVENPDQRSYCQRMKDDNG